MEKKFRLIKSLPKIGIRPTIDGRGNGVRESLEEQTMALAKNVAEFISSQIRHASGEPVECVVADTTIGGVAEAALCEEKFIKHQVDISLTVTPCWCYGTETMDSNKDRIHAVYGFNGTERPGAVYLAAVTAGYHQMGIPVFSIYGQDVQDQDDTSLPMDVKEKLLKFCRSAIAVKTMKDTSYLSVGSVSMGIAGSVVDPSFFSDYLGMRNEYVDMVEIDRRITKGIYDQKEYDLAIDWVRRNCREGKDYNHKDLQASRETFDETWEYVVKMVLIFRDLMVGNQALEAMGYYEESLGHNALIAGFQGQRHWTDYKPNGDFLETILNSSFDWQGIRQAYIVATENDSLNGVVMLFGHLLTGTAQMFSDVRTYWSPESVKRVTKRELTGRAKNGFIHLINSGSTTLDATGQQVNDQGQHVFKPYWDIDTDDVNRCLSASEFCPANKGYFRGGGFSTRFLTVGEMPITMSRINIIKGLGPVLQIAEGYSVEIDADIHNIIDIRTDPAWPTTYFVPNLTGQGAFRDVYTVMDNWGANHGAISYGHIGDELITMASMLRIPVAMHNVDDNRLFRPKVWGAYGTKDLESADYRACKSFGPLYRK